jgi:hypothetical protein
MIKRGTCEQQLWGSYGPFSKVFGNTINFILFQSRL